MRYEIYQLDTSKESVRTLHKTFASWSELQRYCGGFNFGDYKQVYEDEITADKGVIELLEDIFTKFNINHPKDFKGHSLSVSDVVVLDGKMYYCDSEGWQDIN